MLNDAVPSVLRACAGMGGVGGGEAGLGTGWHTSS